MRRSNQPTLLVVADESAAFSLALTYAVQQVQALHEGRVAMLCVVTPQDGIEAFGGVERAMDDEAFSRARERIAQHEAYVKKETGKNPVVYYKKGEPRDVLLELIAQEKGIELLVLAANTQDMRSNPLIRYLTSDKGLRRLKVPLVILPDSLAD
ncbi:MAG: universal stress protein [Alphaproteobacteria bacterium]|nr:universal stress protein [Alphaproteobacteria bacterium]